MSTKGWNSLKPITTPDQMSAPIHWNPMNEDWKAVRHIHLWRDDQGKANCPSS